MAEIINGVPIGDLPGIESVPDDSMLVVEFLGKAYHMPGAVLRQMIQDVLDSMGDSVDDVTEARLTAAIETVLASGKYNGVSPSVEVLDEEDGTSVIHVIDAFGDKRYPVEVKGATDAVRYKPQSLTDAQKKQARANIGALSAADISDKDNEVVIVKISGSFDAGYTVLWGGLPAPAKGLDVLVENGSIVIGVADGDLTFNFLDDTDYNDPYTVPAGTVFSYRNSTFWVSHIVDQKGEIINMTFALESPVDTWLGSVYPEQYTIYLTGDHPGRIVEFFGRKLEPREAYEILLAAANNDIPLLCYQKDAVFRLEDGSTHTPQYGTPFYYDHNTELLHCEHDGYECTLYVDLDDYKATAEKNTPYKTAESKADDLKAEDGTLFLLSAGEPIGAGVPLPTGNADDCKIFIADLNTSTYEDIKAADDAGKICYALWGGYTACMLTTLSPESAIFTTLLDPHLGLYVKFTKGTVGVSDFGLTESHSILYEPQSLTGAQKAQARENIGALSADDIDVDSIGSNVFVGNYDTVTFAEIKAAHDARKVCFLDFDGLMIPLLNLSATEAVFVREFNSTTDFKVTITSDSGKDFTLVDKNTPIYVAQSWSDAQKAQARTNIGAAAAADLSKYVTTGTAQTITGAKTFNAPANVAGTEQHTVKFKTSNGGAIIFGKEAANSGTMLRFDQVDGTTRLRFRGSATAGAIVWEQPEQGAQLYVDLGKQGVDKHRITFPSSGGTLALTSQIPSLSGYLPLSGGLMTGSLKFQAASLPGKSLQYICGVDAFASGGEMGWQSKADFLSGYLTTTGTAAKATADANGNNIASTYANKNAGNTFNGEQKMINSTHCPTMNDIANGVGCSLKNARACDNQLIVAEIFAPTTTVTDSKINMSAVAGEIGFYHGGSGSGGQFSGKTQLARITSAGIYEGSTLLSNKYLAKSGGTMTGALNLKNSTWNLAGDDAYFGDNDTAGSFAIKGANGTTNLKMVTYNGTTYGTLSWNGSNFAFSNALNFPGGTLTGNLTVGSAKIQTNGYIIGTWLQTTAGNASSTAMSKVCVQSPDGWIYTRTLDQLRNDMNAASKDEVVTAANGSLKVTLSGTSVDKTLAQIETALNAGRHVYMVENDGPVYQLSMHMAGMMACFTSVVATSNTQVTVNTVIVYDGMAPTILTKTL